ncbi:MAG: ABC transporter substrate-binding protein [Candidatus Bathyarchaeia archaeon]
MKTSFRVKVLIIALVIIIAVVAGSTIYILTPKETEELRIGFLSSLTGVLAPFGQPCSFAFRKCIEDVNSLGGVIIEGRKCPVRIIEYDDSSDPTKASALAEQLILQDKVHVLVTSAGPPIVQIPISRIADRYKIPTFVNGIFEAWWVSGPYKYAWNTGCWLITPIPENDFRAGKAGYQALLNYIYVTELFSDKINKRTALFAPNDADGRSFYELITKLAQDAGYTVVGIEKGLGLYAPGTMDYTAIIREWKEGEAEVLWGLSPGTDFATMWRQAHTLGWKPKIAMDGRALKQYDDAITIGKDLVIGLIDPFNVWAPYVPYKSCYGERTGMQLAEEWKKETGKEWTDGLSWYTVGEIVCKTIELTGSLDPEKINQAVLQLDIVTLAYGRVKYIPEFHSSPFPMYVGQWVVKNGRLKMEYIYSFNPDVKPTSEPIFPLP